MNDTLRPPPRIETLHPKLLVGMRQEMSAAADTTSELWRVFRPRISDVPNRTTDETISMRVYAAARDVYDARARFRKWAAVEVADHQRVPEGMEPYRIAGGTYAVFVHRGAASDLGTFRYIYGEWLPASDYVVAHREHFEILPAGYDPWDPDATEECWIPVEPKG